MVKTMLTRISKVNQYNSAEETVLWEDNTVSRWENEYGKLEPEDYIIFIGADMLKGTIFIGVVYQITKGKSILCKIKKEIKCTNDQFLQLNEIYPELISRVKANFQPYIHPKTINIPKLIDDVVNKRYISYYIVSGINKYKDISPSLKENDRVILINSLKHFENIKIHSNSGLIDFAPELKISISVVGQTLEQVFQKNMGIKRNSDKSNNLTRIQNIIKSIDENQFYKFNSFYAYYDTLYNKLVYRRENSIGSVLNKIDLLNDEAVFKVSMNSNAEEINDIAFNSLVENNLIAVHYQAIDKSTSTISPGEVFSKQMKIGDYFYLCRGNKFLVTLGKIVGITVPCEYEGLGKAGWVQRSFEPIYPALKIGSYTDEQRRWSPNDNSTCIAIPRNEIEFANKKLFEPYFNVQINCEVKLPIQTENMQIPLNQILFGPPGTGKTYNTINKAIAIANPSFDLGQERMKIKEEFERLMKNDQVVFSTFHQSMSYEDFIEGIKPVEPDKDGDPVIYRIEEGIFRRICIDASFAIAQLQETKSTEEVLDFSIMYDRFIEIVEEKILNGNKVELETKSGGTVLVESISQQGNFIIKHHDGTRTYTVSKARLTKLQSVIKDLNEVSNINDKFRGIIGGSNSSAYWSVLNAIKKEKHTKAINKEARTYSYEDKKEVVRSLSGSDYLNKSGKPYVLIIDEINRGNVSQIFGELITLIEEDKRLGMEEALEVILPYSKERFGVPSNLYIIGTMNTADRSVEAIDTALRRRFNFEEMQPIPELIATHGKLKESNGVLDSIELPLLLKTMNRRIEKLMDKDHQIGHSYLMAVANLKELKEAFQNKIVPLLQEYFFGDYGKIGLVIGKGFFEPEEEPNESIFADFDDYSASEYAERVIYKIKKIAIMTDIEFINAIHLMLKK